MAHHLVLKQQQQAPNNFHHQHQVLRHAQNTTSFERGGRVSHFNSIPTTATSTNSTNLTQATSFGRGVRQSYSTNGLVNAAAKNVNVKCASTLNVYVCSLLFTVQCIN